MKDKDPVSASGVVWLIYNGYVPREDNYTYKNRRMELPEKWTKGDFYQATRHWAGESLGLSGYYTNVDYCSMRGDDLEDVLPSWQATDQLLR